MKHKLDGYYLRKYGINWERREKMLKAQKGKCYLCGKHESEFKRRLHVDHNHATKKVRKLLCFTCNRRRVGQLTLKWAKAVYFYLLEHE